MAYTLQNEKRSLQKERTNFVFSTGYAIRELANLLQHGVFFFFFEFTVTCWQLIKKCNSHLARCHLRTEDSRPSHNAAGYYLGCTLFGGLQLGIASDSCVFLCIKQTKL